MPILPPTGAIDLLGTFPVVELRRYLIHPGKRDEFATYFDAYFPDAIQHAGGIIAAQVLEHDRPDVFTWIRGFHSYDDRAAVNAALYDGPLWKEHGPTMNARLGDHENTLLLQPAARGDEMAVLRAVDAVTEADGARGRVLALIVRAVSDAAVDDVVAQIHALIDSAEPAAWRTAGLLRTLDADNNFPGLPFRTDGPYVVWLGVAADDAGVASWRGLVASIASLAAGDDAELVVGRPSARSRLRWLTPPA